MHVLNITASNKKMGLREAREEAGLSLDEVSRQLNINKDDLITYENESSEMGFGVAVALGELYNIPLHRLDFSE